MKFTHSGHELNFTIKHLFIAGWTGRDRAAVDHHIQELAELGISAPSQVPLYYRTSNTLLTQNNSIEVLGKGTSGEVEPLIIQQDNVIWIGLASDHTDRDLEAYSVASSKQICMKPAATELWKYDDVKDHLDDLIMRCSIKEKGEWITYQQGSLANIRPLAELMDGAKFDNNCAMLCGTLAAIGGVRPALEYKLELEDPILKRCISMSYSVNQLPIIE